MATRSILKNITIRKKRAAARLADILEKSSEHEKNVLPTLTKRYEVIDDPETIRKIFDK